MIKFEESSENYEKSPKELAEKYKFIKPMEKMSDAEVDDFWAGEFAKEKDEQEMDIYDKLLSEIFNRSEEELPIEFEIDGSLQKILENFSLEKWQDMSNIEKITEIKNLVKEVGNRLGLEKLPNIEYFDGENEAYGNFDPLKNTINLNKQYLGDSKELVNTITHELRHAYQNMRAEIFDTWEDALYKCNFDNYISPLSLPGGGYLFFVDYQNQYVEVEARAFANKFTEAMS